MTPIPIRVRSISACSSKCIAAGVIFCAAVLLSASTGTPQELNRKNVLIINQVGLSYPGSALITQQIGSALQADSRYEIELYSESLDSVSIPDEASQHEFRDWLSRKYRNHKMDVIVAMGPAAIRFIAQSPSDFFPHTPVVICGSSEEQAGALKLDSRFTGTWLEIKPGKTIDVAISVLPDTREIFVVGGTSEYDRTNETITRAALRPYEARFKFTYLFDLPIHQLLSRLQHLPAHSIVLYVSFFQDAAGQEFLNATAALPRISEAANAPVFGMSDTYLRHGIVGGYVLNFVEQGNIAARVISEILGGKKAADIPIVNAPSTYMFDAEELRRWQLDKATLPAGSVVLDREPTLWERAKWMLLGALQLIATLGGLVAYLLYKQKQLARAKGEQMRLSGMLINAHEEERRRVAAELHDDFSQRLALLSLGIETAAEDAPRGTQQQLHELLNSASEIGADLHALSHRLHSATLERLGLVPALSSLCKELNGQQKIRVAFSHNDVPRCVTSDIALCLFRVVQESLRNIRKHSGCSHAEVELNRNNGDLHLSISDDGMGFDVSRLAHNQGLGILSMEERARLIGARFSICSEPQKGTRIDVWAPFKANGHWLEAYDPETRRTAASNGGPR